MKNIDKEELSTYISITRITISICWITLIIFWVIKLLGGNWFEVAVQNENFVKFSKFVETTWLKYLVSFITIFLTNYFLFCSIDERFIHKGKHFVLIFLFILSMWFVTNFVPNSFLGIRFWFGYSIIIIYAIIKKKGWKKVYGVIAVSLTLVFTGISIIVRNQELKMISDFLVSNILAIDVYIMIGLYYLYVNLIRLKKRRINLWHKY